MPTINHRTIRRFYEAALRDRNPQAFYDDFSEALRRQEVKPEDFSLRRLFAEFVPSGRELLESWNPRSGGGVQLQEANSAVDLAAFSNITGQVVYHAILAGMQAEELVFSKQLRTIPTAFDGEKIPRSADSATRRRVSPKGSLIRRSEWAKTGSKPRRP